MTATVPSPTAAGPQTLVPASSRVSLLVGNDPNAHQIDLLLPAAVPLGKLTEPTRDVLNQRLRSIGAEELPEGTAFVFARAAGMTLLSGNLSLAAQGINDADLLAFIPHSKAQRYEPNIENVSAAIARWAKKHFPAVSALDAARVAVALTLVALALASALVWRLRWGGPGSWVAPVVFGVAAVSLAVAAMLSSRLSAERFVTAATTWAAVAALTIGAATVPPGAHPGAPHAFLAAVVAALASTALARFTGRYWTAATTIATVSVAVAGARGHAHVLRRPWPTHRGGDAGRRRDGQLRRVLDRATPGQRAAAEFRVDHRQGHVRAQSRRPGGHHLTGGRWTPGHHADRRAGR